MVGLAASWTLLQRQELQQCLVHIMRATLRRCQLAGATLNSAWWPYHEPTGPRLRARRFVACLWMALLYLEDEELSGLFLLQASS